MVSLQALVDLDVAGSTRGSTRGSMELDEVEVDLLEVELGFGETPPPEPALARGPLDWRGPSARGPQGRWDQGLPVYGAWLLPPLGLHPLVASPLHDWSSHLPFHELWQCGLPRAPIWPCPPAWWRGGLPLCVCIVLNGPAGFCLGSWLGILGIHLCVPLLGCLPCICRSY